MKKKNLTKWVIGVCALTMATLQPTEPLPNNSLLNTSATVEAAVNLPEIVTLKNIKATGYNKIQINWNPAAGATHYRIYYKTPGGRWNLITTVRSNITSYTHTSSSKYPIRCGQNYIYTVRAYNSNSKRLGNYNAKGLTVRTIPTTVSLQNIRNNSNNTVSISWKRAYGGNYYRVYRKTAGTGWKLLANVKSSNLSYTDKNPVRGQKNIYTVRLYNSITNVAGEYNRNGIAISVGNISTVTPGKTILANISSPAYNKVTISWKKATNATHYRIYYKVPGGSWKHIATVGSNITRYTHTASAKFPITVGRNYIYTVRAYNSTSQRVGTYDSNGLAVNTMLSAPAVTSWRKTHDSTTCNCKVPHNGVEYTITWKKVPGANGYQVFCGTNDNGTWHTRYTNTTKLNFSESFSHIEMRLMAKVRAYTTVNGRKVYGPWSTVKSIHVL